MREMRAAVFEREGVLTLKNVPMPRITKPDQVLIAVEAVSICGTDVHITATPPGYPAAPNTILGHELVGHIAEKGADVTYLSIGDRVVVNPNNYCGNCVFCRMNLPNECLHIEPLGIDYDGAFAEYCVVSAKCAYPISENVPMECAACAEPLACAINGLNKVRVVPGDSAVIIGGGPIGLMLVMLLKAAGAGRVYLAEVSPERAAFARGLEICRVLNPREEDVDAVVAAETGIGADIVFDATGSQIAAAIHAVRKGGTVVLFGVNKRARAEIAQSEITTKEISVLGTWLANATFPSAVKALESRLIPIEKLITDVIPLEDIHAGIRKLAKGKAIKVVVRIAKQERKRA